MTVSLATAALFTFLSLETPADAGAPSPVSPADARRAAAAPWQAATAPAPGRAEAIGTPTNGCVRGAVPLRGSRFVTLVHPERRRHFGHPSLVAYLGRLARRARTAKLAPIGVGDLAQARGGPTPSGHRSHQTGLDVDVAYGPPATALPGRVGPTVVAADRKTVLPEHRERVLALVRLAAEDAAVDRVFVHPAIKRALCDESTAAPESLARVRPWWGHDDHLHVRVRCPAENPACVERDPPPTGTGCENLAWWWSEDASQTSLRRSEEAARTGPPPMPAPCSGLIAPGREDRAELNPSRR